VLDTQVADNAKARIVLPDGRSDWIDATGMPPFRSQERLYELAATSSAGLPREAARLS
jgi:hypothetical protein